MSGEAVIISAAVSAAITATANRRDVVKALKNLKRVQRDHKAKPTNAPR